MTLDFSYHLLVGLAIVGKCKTGLANYAAHISARLPAAGVVFLRPDTVPVETLAFAGAANTWIDIPSHLSADDGKAGHWNRLCWTQTQLPKLYRQNQASLFFSPLPEAPLWAGCRSVVMVHDLIPLRFPHRRSPLYPYFRFYIPQVLHQAQHILCNSQATAQEITEVFGIAAQKITPIPLAHDAENFRDQGVPRGNYFVHLGRHDPHKNVGLIIRALARMPGGDRPELWLVGPEDPRYTPLLKAQAYALGVGERVKFLGYVPYGELPQVIGGAIALIFPSLWEGFGFPVLEAMACGTPVITANVAALPEVAGDAALLIDPRNVAELTSAMTTLATDSRAHEQLRTAGLRRAAQFSWDKTAQQTAEVLYKFL